MEASGQFVVHQPPRQHLRIGLIVAGGKTIAWRRVFGGRSRRQFLAQQGWIVHHLALGAELHRPVRVAFTRGKRIPERHDEEVLDHQLWFAQLSPIGQLDRNGDTGLATIERIRHARYGELSVQGERLVSVLPPALRGCQAQMQSPLTLASCPGAIRMATVCASGRT